jgi:hypothetical protein
MDYEQSLWLLAFGCTCSLGFAFGGWFFAKLITELIAEFKD